MEEEDVMREEFEYGDSEGKSEKLTEWENPPSVRDLIKDYQDALSAHTSHMTDITKWRDNLKMVGSAKPKKELNRSSVAPKLIRKQAEWRYTSLSEPFLSTDDVFNTDPVTHLDKEAAEQSGSVLNYQFNKQIKKVAFFDEFIRAVVDDGTAVVRVGWDYREEEKLVDVPIMTKRLVTDPQQRQALVQAGQSLVEEIQTGSEKKLQMVALVNQPTVEVCEPENLVWDPTARGEMDKAGFMVFSFATSLSELEEEGFYHNLGFITYTDGSILADPDDNDAMAVDEASFKFRDKPRQKFMAREYWGFWDIHNTGVVQPIVATWVGNVMIRMEENPFPDKKIPFISVQYLPVRKSNYGEPDGELLEDNQKIIGAVTRGMIDIMARSANGQMGIKKATLDVTNRRKFERGLDYEFNQNSDARSSFYTHTFAQIPSSAEFMLEQQNAEAESLTGIKAFSQGITGASLGNTATGAKSAMDATSERKLGILRRLAEGVIEIGRKMSAMNAEWLSEEEIARITDKEVIPNKDYGLSGNYDVNLSISTAEADNEKAQELAFMLQTTGNNMDVGMQKLIMGNIAKLRKMPVLAKMLEEYEPQPDPIAIKKAELEIELLAAQVRNENAKAQENTVDVDYKKAKTVTEEAKARDIHSSADAKDMDFLDKDSGAAHERDLQTKQMDNDLALDLKAADSMLAADKSLAPTAGKPAPLK